jgi:YD repeat-containing protein
MSLARFFSHLLTFAFLLLASHAHASVINGSAFDPASNLIDTNQRDIQREESGLALETEKHTTSKLLDNLLKDYAGTHYRHDERGNLVEKITNGERIRYQWNASNQLTKVETADTITQFAYDPLKSKESL